MLVLGSLIASSPAFAKTKPAPRAEHTKSEEKINPQLHEADQAYLDSDFAKALELYQKLDSAEPSAKTRLKLADCLRELGKFSEAHGVLSSIVNESEVKPDAKEKARAEQALAKLKSTTSVLVIQVNEKDAQILVDEVEIGRGPFDRAIWRKPGPTRVVVTKPGFEAFTKGFDFAVGAEERVEVVLKPDQTSGTLVVQLVGKESADLVLDGKEVGSLPWSGDVPAGVHEISARGPHGISATRKIAVSSKGRSELELNLVANPAKIRVTASDARAFIRIDGTPYGSGQIENEVLPGKHIVSVEQPGYVPSVFNLVLEPGELKALDHVALERSALLPNARSARTDRGIYTIIALDGLIGKSTNAFASACPASGIGGTCSSGPTFGGQIDVHVGYSFGTFGAEGFLLSGTNFTLARMDIPQDVGVSESAWYGIARKERFLLFEPVFGGGAAGRVSTQGKSFRLSTAVGLGLAYRFTELHRKVETQGGSSSGAVLRRDNKSDWTGGSGKTVPMFIWDSEIQLGPTPGTRIFLGIHSQIEFGSEPPVTPAAGTLGFDAASGNALPLGAGPIDVRRSPAFYVGPRFGVVTGM
jgi:hypothetical protein